MPITRRLFLLAAAGVLLVGLAAAAALAQSPASSEPAGPPGQELFIVPVAIGAEGSEAVFVVSHWMRLEVTEFDDPQGVLGPPPELPLVEERELAVRLQLRVLLPDPSGSPRVLVRAEPIDPGTRLPLAETVWAKVYVVSGDQLVEEAGERIPLAYRHYEPLVRPDWLRHWLQTAPADLADLEGRALRPGDAWQGLAAIDVPELLVLEGAPLPASGRFTGWTEVPVGDGWAAHVEEAVQGSVTAVRPAGADLSVEITASLTGESHVWIVPGDFIYALNQSIDGELVAQPVTEPGTIPASIMRLAVQQKRTVERELGTSLQAAAGPPFPVVVIGETVRGSLTASSFTFVDGTYADYYILYGIEGDEIAIRLESGDFDAYLILMDENEDALEWNDDGGGGTDALIRVTLPYTGMYYIVANAYFAGTGGEYTLSVTRESLGAPAATTAADQAGAEAEAAAAEPKAAPEAMGAPEEMGPASQDAGAAAVGMDATTEETGTAAEGMGTAGEEAGGTTAAVGATEATPAPPAAGAAGQDETVQLILRAVALLPGLQAPENMSAAELLEVQNVLYKLFLVAWDEMDRRAGE